MQRGYVKLWRKTLDSGLLQNGPAWQVFGYLMLKASHKTHKQIVGGSVFQLQPGQLIFGRKKTAADLQLGEQQIRTAILLLKKLEIITTSITNKCTVISLVNWHTYQDEQPATNQQDNQQPNQMPTRCQPTTNQHLTTNKNVSIKEELEYKDTPLPPVGGESERVAPAPVRKGKQPTEYSPDFEHFWQLYPRKIGKDAAWKVYQRRKHEIPTGENMAAILARHAQTEQWQRDGGQYIPHPTTWLNQGRWADDVTPVVGIASREVPPSPEAQRAMDEILRERTPEELEKNRQAAQKYRQEWQRKRGIDECLSAQG